jgi:hypothetical protein
LLVRDVAIRLRAGLREQRLVRRGCDRARRTFAFAALWALTALGCGAGVDPFDQAPAAPPALPPVQLDIVVFEGFHGDLRDLSVTAASASVDMLGKRAELRSVSIGVTSEERGKLSISAPHGEFRLDKDDFAV